MIGVLFPRLASCSSNPFQLKNQQEKEKKIYHIHRQWNPFQLQQMKRSLPYLLIGQKVHE